MKRAPGTFLSALGSNPPRFSRQIKETSAWMSLLFGQSVKEVSPSYELFGIMGKKRTGGEKNGTVATG